MRGLVGVWGCDGENQDLVGRARSEDRDTEYKGSEEGTQNGESGSLGQRGPGAQGRKNPQGEGLIRRHPEFKAKNGEGKSKDGGLRKEGVSGRMGHRPADRPGLQEGTHTCQNCSLLSTSTCEAASSPQTPGTPHTCCPHFTGGEHGLQRERCWACGVARTEAAPCRGWVR